MNGTEFEGLLASSPKGPEQQRGEFEKAGWISNLHRAQRSE